MSDINIKKDSKLIKVLADQSKGVRVDSANSDEVSAIMRELAQDASPQNLHQLAQTVAFTVEELQQGELDFLNSVADIKNIGYGDKAAFNVKTRGIKAYYQAKGATTPRSYVAGRQILVGTEEISARPAINLMDLRTGRVQMSDLIAEANREMTNMKLVKIEQVLIAALTGGAYASPFYATGTGVVKSNIDGQIAYFRRLGPVTLLGDLAAVGQLAELSGMAMDNSIKQYSNEMINEFNANAYLGRYNGCNVVCMNNTYEAGKTTPILHEDMIYIIPGNVSGDYRNLKVVNEGGVQAFDSQNIDDMVFEIRLDQWFGAAFVTGELPTIGAYLIG